MITIDINDLKIGMYVAKLDRPWEGTPFLFQGFLIRSNKQIQTLQSLCHQVEIDEEKSDPSLNLQRNTTGLSDQTTVRVTSTSTPAPTLQYSEIKPIGQRIVYEYAEKPFEEEMSVAKQVYANTSISLNKVLEDVRLSKGVTAVEVKACVHTVIDGVMANPNALALLSSLKSKQQDTVRHSTNVCIISLLFGRYLGFTKEQLSTLGFAALLHDIGEIKIAQSILDKHNRGLTPEEKKQLEKHTEFGYQMLRANPEIPIEAAGAAYQHHERINGKGYPNGLKGSQISLFARLLSIVDVYESVTNYPGAKIQVPCSDALKSIYSMCDTFFDRILVEEFIRCLGIYPIGSVVELNNYDIGVVIAVKPGKNLMPTVMIIKNSKGEMRNPPQIINLDNFREEDGTPRLLINRVLAPDSVGIDLSDFIIREIGFGSR